MNRSNGEPQPERYSCAHEHIRRVADAAKPLAKPPFRQNKRADDHNGYARKYGGTIDDKAQIEKAVIQQRITRYLAEPLSRISNRRQRSVPGRRGCAAHRR